MPEDNIRVYLTDKPVSRPVTGKLTDLIKTTGSNILLDTAGKKLPYREIALVAAREEDKLILIGHVTPAIRGQFYDGLIEEGTLVYLAQVRESDESPRMTSVQPEARVVGSITMPTAEYDALFRRDATPRGDVPETELLSQDELDGAERTMLYSQTDLEKAEQGKPRTEEEVNAILRQMILASR